MIMTQPVHTTSMVGLTSDKNLNQVHCIKLYIFTNLNYGCIVIKGKDKKTIKKKLFGKG